MWTSEAPAGFVRRSGPGRQVRGLTPNNYGLQDDRRGPAPCESTLPDRDRRGRARVAPRHPRRAASLRLTRRDHPCWTGYRNCPRRARGRRPGGAWRRAPPNETGAWRARHGQRRDRRASSERSEEHTSELQSLMRISYAVFCLKKKQKKKLIGTLK